MARKKSTLSEEDKKNIAILQENNRMLERTKEQAKLHGNAKSVERIEIAQKEVVEHIRSIDSTAELFPDDSENLIEHDDLLKEMIKVEPTEEDKDIYEKIKEAKKDEDKKNNTSTKETIVERSASVLSSTDIDDLDGNVQYDIIQLPSEGQCYKNKVSRVPVSYLTAYDENFLTSPNLYKDGIVIDFLLKQKVMNSEINVDDLVSGDADAITLFLRATAYGNDFPIRVLDPDSGEYIETVADLSKIKYKKFTLKGDENGWFDFDLPISKDKLKFRFLTRRDIKNLTLLANLDQDGYKAAKLGMIHDDLNIFINGDKILTKDEKVSMLKMNDKIADWQKRASKKDGVPFTKAVTNKMEMHIMSVNGNEDRSYISKYVKNMGTRDALEFRKYVTANEPAVDFNIEVQRPNGGTLKTFLEWDDAIFFNI